MMANNILTPLQSSLLTAFFNSVGGYDFYLTGGTALAAFYLQHRLSEDLDIFTTEEADFEMIRREFASIAQQLGGTLSSGILTATMQQYFITHANETVKVDLVRDVGAQFGEKRLFGPVRVDAPENIGANKITAILSRTTAKDFVDLYFLLHTGLEFESLFEMATEKDGGLNKFYLAWMMRQVQKVEHLPIMLKPLDINILKTFYLDLADQLLREIKPD